MPTQALFDLEKHVDLFAGVQGEFPSRMPDPLIRLGAAECRMGSDILFEGFVLAD